MLIYLHFYVSFFLLQVNLSRVNLLHLRSVYFHEMGVDLLTYRCRIGCNRCLSALIPSVRGCDQSDPKTGSSSRSRSVRNLGSQGFLKRDMDTFSFWRLCWHLSVVCIVLFLVLGGVEQNPGPMSNKSAKTGRKDVIGGGVLNADGVDFTQISSTVHSSSQSLVNDSLRDDILVSFEDNLAIKGSERCKARLLDKTLNSHIQCVKRMSGKGKSMKRKHSSLFGCKNTSSRKSDSSTNGFMVFDNDTGVANVGGDESLFTNLKGSEQCLSSSPFNSSVKRKRTQQNVEYSDVHMESVQSQCNGADSVVSGGLTPFWTLPNTPSKSGISSTPINSNKPHSEVFLRRSSRKRKCASKCSAECCRGVVHPNLATLTNSIFQSGFDGVHKSKNSCPASPVSFAIPNSEMNLRRSSRVRKMVQKFSDDCCCDESNSQKELKSFVDESFKTPYQNQMSFDSGFGSLVQSGDLGVSPLVSLNDINNIDSGYVSHFDPSSNSKVECNSQFQHSVSDIDDNLVVLDEVKHCSDRCYSNLSLSAKKRRVASVQRFRSSIDVDKRLVLNAKRRENYRKKKMLEKQSSGDSTGILGGSPLLRKRKLKVVRKEPMVDGVSDIVHGNNTLLEKAKKQFLLEIKKRMDCVCRVCHRTLFRKSVIVYNESKYNHELDVVRDAFKVDPVEKNGSSFVCKTCHVSLKKGKLPAQAVANDLHLVEIPPELACLNELEVRFLAQRLLFMKLVALPKGGQRGVQGPCVNVPARLNKACELFPRLADEIELVEFKLKRKICYKSHYMHMKINPNAIMKGLLWLKLHNKEYADINVNVNWEQYADDNQAMAILMGKCAGPDVMNDSCIDEDLEKDEERLEKEFQADQIAADENVETTILPMSSCIQPEDSGGIFSLAPGEGSIPVSVLHDDKMEVLAFPNLFPTAEFAFDSVHDRKTRLHLRRYLDQRLLHFSGRFALNTDFLFAIQFRTTVEQVVGQQGIALCMKKGKTFDGQNLNAGMLKNKEIFQSMMYEGHAYKFLTQVRGSPAFWQRNMFDTLAMVRSCGVPTFFLTLSAAEFHWVEMIQALASQYGDEVSEEDVKKMNWDTKSKYLRSNPVIAVKLFEYRVQALFDTFLKSDAHPIGFVEDYIIKTEFQARGSPHAHCLLWIKNAPKLKVDSSEKVVEFIQQHVTAKIPDDDPDFADLVSKRQSHKHSAYCRRRNGCRFGFPKPLSFETLVTKNVGDSDKSQSKMSEAKRILKKVYDLMEEKEDLSLAELLDKVHVSREKYQDALSLSTTGSVIVIQRDSKEKFINSFHKDILYLWRANMDFQFVTDAVSAVMYVCSYMMKSDAAMGELLKAVSRECRRDDVRTQMRKLGNAFLRKREVSQQEAIMLGIGMPLMRKSRLVKFVNAHSEDQRTRIPCKGYKFLDNEDEDIFENSLYDWYGARNSSLDSMCLATFATTYDVAKSGSDLNTEKPHDYLVMEAGEEDILSSEGVSYNGVIDEIENPLCPVSNEILPRNSFPAKFTIELKGKKRTFRKRKRPSILRTHIPEVTHCPEDYYFGNLLLFHPWKSEQDFDSDSPTKYMDFYMEHKDVVQRNAVSFNYDDKEIEEAWRKLSAGHLPKTAWENCVAPGAEEQNAEAMEEGMAICRDHDVEENDIPDMEKRVNMHDVLAKRYSSQAKKLVMDSASYKKNYMLLNECQKKMVDFNRKWCKDYVSSMAAKGESIKGYNVFLSGPGGSGKSFVLQMIHRDTCYFYSKLKSVVPDNPLLLMTAYTGTAAFVIDGITLHSALNLGGCSGMGLADDKRTVLQTRLHDLVTIVIDECSMVSPGTLIDVHNRLSVAKHLDTSGEHFFGNVNVLCVGDPFQLPPVQAANIFEMPKHCRNVSQLNSLWDQFKFIELTQVMRQKDSKLANVLNAVRLGTPDMDSPEDLLLKSCEIEDNPDSECYPKDVLHVYATNLNCKIRNEQRLGQLEGKLITIPCVDRTREKNTNVSDFSLSDNPMKTGRLVKNLMVKKNARVMLTDNMDVCDGLTNGVMGTISGFIWERNPVTNNSEVIVILVKFDSVKIGISAKKKSKFKHVCADSVPLHRIMKEFNHRDTGDNSCLNQKMKTVKFQRYQFPIFLAWAVTIHKVQGMTLDGIVVDMDLKKGRYQAGQAYVALSRVRSLENLHILHYNRIQIKSSKLVQRELNRLRDTCMIEDDAPFFHMDRNGGLNMMCLNVRGLNCHKRFFSKLKEFDYCDVVCLTETHLEIGSSWDIPVWNKSHFKVFRKDRDCHGGGVAVCTSSQYGPVQIQVDTILELVVVEIAAPFEMVIVCVYRPPSQNLSFFCKELCNVISSLKVDRSSFRFCITGDFNEDLISNPSSPLLNEMKVCGFSQKVKDPTYDAGSMLDHLYVLNMDVSVKTSDCFFSDHNAILCHVCK